MELYPYKFGPIYKEKIWGGRSLAMLFARNLPDPAAKYGESWELADLVEGTSVVSNGPLAGESLTELTKNLGSDLLGKAAALPNGRFPLLLKLLDANDILSLQVHPDSAAAEQIGGDAALKTECWYVVESRDGYIYKGLQAGATPEGFRDAIESDKAQELTRRIDCATGDFHYLPAGTVHAVGPGLVVAEVQTPSDTTYRVTDWGRGREIHVEMSMKCIHFEPGNDESPGADGDTLLVTEFFTVAAHSVEAASQWTYGEGKCVMLMLLDGSDITITHDGPVELETAINAGDTVLIPAALSGVRLHAPDGGRFLEITLPDSL